MGLTQQDIPQEDISIETSLFLLSCLLIKFKVLYGSK